MSVLNGAMSVDPRPNVGSGKELGMALVTGAFMPIDGSTMRIGCRSAYTCGHYDPRKPYITSAKTNSVSIQPICRPCGKPNICGCMDYTDALETFSEPRLTASAGTNSRPRIRAGRQMAPSATALRVIESGQSDGSLRIQNAGRRFNAQPIAAAHADDIGLDWEAWK